MDNVYCKHKVKQAYIDVKYKNIKHRSEQTIRC